MSHDTPAPTEALDAQLERLRLAGAASVDAVGWHYIETLTARSRLQAAPAQALLHEKILHALHDFEGRISRADKPTPQAWQASPPSPMALLLRDMTPPPATPSLSKATFLNTHQESPRVQQFRKQLRTISVQKQISHAMAQAPQNAGPINSHMLVLRALGLMRELSPDYLQRFMAYVNTLMVLENAVTPTATKTTTRKTGSMRKPRQSV